jgi:hypothetical protein
VVVVKIVFNSHGQITNTPFGVVIPREFIKALVAKRFVITSRNRRCRGSRRVAEGQMARGTRKLSAHMSLMPLFSATRH